MLPDLRERLSAALLDRREAIAADAVSLFQFTGSGLEPEYSRRIGMLLIGLLAGCVRGGGVAERDVNELHALAVNRGLAAAGLFGFCYIVERATLDDLALHESIGAGSQEWPALVQHIRRGAFDALAAFTARALRQPTAAALSDPLTTLHTRQLFDTVLSKYSDRAGRLGHSLSMILFDVDHLGATNQQHGRGVGDRLLERLGILIRGFFRQHDWVARHADDAIAVLLTAGDADHAAALAERVRSTVGERLAFHDHRTDTPVRVTLSAGVLTINPAPGDVIDIERAITMVEAALHRAKQSGRNRIETVLYASRSS